MHFFASFALFLFSWFLFFSFFWMNLYVWCIFRVLFWKISRNGKGRFGPEFRKALWSLCSTLGLFTKKSSQKSQAHKRRSFNLGVGDLSSEKESRQRATFDQNKNKMYVYKNCNFISLEKNVIILQWYLTHKYFHNMRNLAKYFVKRQVSENIMAYNQT